MLWTLSGGQMYFVGKSRGHTTIRSESHIIGLKWDTSRILTDEIIGSRLCVLARDGWSHRDNCLRVWELSGESSGPSNSILASLRVPWYTIVADSCWFRRTVLRTFVHHNYRFLFQMDGYTHDAIYHIRENHWEFPGVIRYSWIARDPGNWQWNIIY